MNRLALALFFAAALACAPGRSVGNADGGASDSGVGDGGMGDGGTLDAGPADAGGGPGTYVLYEKFNEMPTGAAPSAPWVSSAADGGSVVVQELPFPTDKSVEIQNPAGQGAARLSIAFPAQSGRVVFEGKVRPHQTAGFKAIPYIYDSAGDAVASVSFQDGNIQAHVGGTVVSVQPFAAGIWYRVRVVVDTVQGAFDLLVDGVRVCHAQTLRTAASSVVSLSYYVDGPAGGALDVDNIKVYNEAVFIGSPPAPVFDPRTYGAVGDGATYATSAIQQAINAAAGTGGSVLLSQGTYLSGTLTLGSNMTMFIDASATLLGSADAGDYPAQMPDTGNTQLVNCKRALLYAPDTSQLSVDGSGMIDGQGDSFSGVEATRPILIWAVLSDHLAIRNVSLKKGAVWGLVSMESDDVAIENVNIQSNDITHDGIDVVDGTNITVNEAAVQSGDDAMCMKSGVRRGIDTMTVSDSLFSGSNGGSNGIKFGTASYGAFTNVAVQDSYVKDVQYAAMAVESREGANVAQVGFQGIEFANVGSAFFVYLAQQSTTHPVGDVPKLGSVDGVSFMDILGATASWPNSPHQGSLITGNIFDGGTYPISNVSFSNVAVVFEGGLTSVPPSPPEATPNQYPESNMFGDLPAWGYYLRHVVGVSFDACTANLANADARQELVTDDVADLSGTP